MVAVFVVTEELLVTIFTFVQSLFTVNPPEMNACVKLSFISIKRIILLNIH